MVQPSIVVIDGCRDLTVYSPTSFPPFPSRLLPVFLLFPLPSFLHFLSPPPPPPLPPSSDPSSPPLTGWCEWAEVGTLHGSQQCFAGGPQGWPSPQLLRQASQWRVSPTCYYSNSPLPGWHTLQCISPWVSIVAEISLVPSVASRQTRAWISRAGLWITCVSLRTKEGKTHVI